MRAELVSAWLLGLLAVVSLVRAAEPAKSTPDPELLEFVGTWETADGQTVDPFALQHLDDKALSCAKPATDNTAKSRCTDTGDKAANRAETEKPPREIWQ